MPSKQLSYILVGDHLGQVKKVLPDSGEITLLTGCAEPSSSNPIVSIEPIEGKHKQLIGNKNGELYVYDCIRDETKLGPKVEGDLIRALPVGTTNKDSVILIYDKQIVLEGQDELVKHKKGEIRNANVHGSELGIVGKDIPLRLFDIEGRKKIFDAEPPEKDWLGIRPEVNVAALDFVARTRVATCSKSDSVIRIYDTQSKPKPVILVDINQTAFNEHAEASRFTSVASTGDDGRTIVVGSNVGQILAIDLRFNVKVNPKKRLQPKTSKVLGGFKGPRGATIKDIKIVPTGDNKDIRVISCCLDRYLRIHLAKHKSSRELERHVYMNTKPFCCTPVFER